MKIGDKVKIKTGMGAGFIGEIKKFITPDLAMVDIPHRKCWNKKIYSLEVVERRQGHHLTSIFK